MSVVVVLLLCVWSVVCYPNVTDLITRAGYPCENHYVTTEDGFVLNMQRIPHGRQEPNPKQKRPVVLLQHGLLDSACTWVLNPPNEALGFLLADAGFDVFLGNARGNTYSSVNTKYSTDSDTYWDLIDFDNMAAIDLPTMINKGTSFFGEQC